MYFSIEDVSQVTVYSDKTKCLQKINHNINLFEKLHKKKKKKNLGKW